MTIIAYRGKKRITYSYRFWFRGQLFKRTLGTQKAMAVEAEKRHRQDLERAVFESTWGPLMPHLTPWKDAVEMFVTAKSAKRSLDWDRRRLRWWGEWLEGQELHYLQEITPEILDRAMLTLARTGKSPATVQRYLAVLSTLCNLGIKRRLLKENPVAAIDWPKARPPDYRIPTPEELHRLIAACDTVLKPIVLTAIYTGLRRGDILRLTAEDLKQRQGWIRGEGSKPGRTAWLPVAKPLQEALDRLGVISGPLFRNPDGSPLRTFHFYRWEIARTKAGLPWLRFHDLRHSCGELLSAAGVPQRAIQAWLGHSTGKMTERYTRPQDAGLELAAKTLTRQMRRTKKRPTNS